MRDNEWDQKYLFFLSKKCVTPIGPKRHLSSILRHKVQSRVDVSAFSPTQTFFSLFVLSARLNVEHDMSQEGFMTSGLGLMHGM